MELLALNQWELEVLKQKGYDWIDILLIDREKATRNIESKLRTKKNRDIEDEN